MDADAMDRHIPYSSGDSPSSSMDRHIPSSSGDSPSSSMHSPSAMILHSSFSAQLPKLHSSVKKTKSSKLTDSMVMDADAIDRHITSSSGESHSSSMDSPSAMMLHSSFSAQLPKLLSSVNKNINTRSSKY